MKTLVPLDDLAHIIDILAVKPDNQSLRELSRTCKFMVPLCRRHLFSSVRLRSNSNTPKQIGLVHFLSGSPDVACRIKKLSYIVKPHAPSSRQIIDILEVLRSQSTSLQSVSLSSESVRCSDWNALQEPTKSLLISLMQLPTVTHLQLRYLKNFPLVALSLCSNLADISVHNVFEAPSSSYADQIITRSKVPTPVSLRIGDFNFAISVLMRPPGPNIIDPIIDFSCLENASFNICVASDASQMAEILKMVTRLRTLIIDYEDPLQLAGLGSSLATNAYQTLKSVILYLNVDREHFDPLCGLTLALRQLSGHNVLEELDVSVLVETDEPCRTDSDDWSDLDTVLTDQSAFRMLRRVTVKLLWYSYQRDEVQVADLLHKLTADRFPRLLESSAVQFVFNEEHTYI
ncbi:hypothetical protein HYPSUDRAFT_72683 [Hypholoma sublateritium FD-334 SS-4]|uniref:F-box domain-containing protein n=1 Tax=Hypholoma sublateritium (strain FD-334 SS-4) TaxID=945553 RepID=A0A0D2N509_HYPSF|nr:hypothetical protein HYPSUDRAFT_72683 [Hypholoma sublateritium FD-334 SS-4]